jgi:hypothetical protein
MKNVNELKYQSIKEDVDTRHKPIHGIEKLVLLFWTSMVLIIYYVPITESFKLNLMFIISVLHISVWLFIYKHNLNTEFYNDEIYEVSSFDLKSQRIVIDGLRTEIKGLTDLNIDTPKEIDVLNKKLNLEILVDNEVKKTLRLVMTDVKLVNIKNYLSNLLLSVMNDHKAVKFRASVLEELGVLDFYVIVNESKCENLADLGVIIDKTTLRMKELTKMYVSTKDRRPMITNFKNIIQINELQDMRVEWLELVSTMDDKIICLLSDVYKADTCFITISLLLVLNPEFINDDYIYKNLLDLFKDIKINEIWKDTIQSLNIRFKINKLKT